MMNVHGKGEGFGTMLSMVTHGQSKGFCGGGAALLMNAHGEGKGFCSGGVALSMDAHGEGKGFCGGGDGGGLSGFVNTIHIIPKATKT